MITFHTAQDTFEPTTLPSNVIPLNCAQVNVVTTATMIAKATDEELAELQSRLRALYLVQLDRAHDTLGDLMKANDELVRRNRGRG